MGLRGAAFHARRISRLLRKPGIRKAYRARWKEINRIPRVEPDVPHWHQRSLEEYNHYFGAALKDFFHLEKEPTIVFLLKQLCPKGHGLRVLEDGPGNANNLAGIKQLMLRSGVPVSVTALGKHHRGDLLWKLQTGEIDEAIFQKAERFVPKKTYTAMLSVFGSLSYAINPIRKDLLLMFAHALEKNGVLLMAFTLKEKTLPMHGTKATPKRLGAISGSLSPNAHQSRRVRPPISEGMKGKKVLGAATEMRGIERALGKRGFRARFYPFSGSGELDPNFVLVVQRQ
jgi:hypothetical protein